MLPKFLKVIVRVKSLLLTIGAPSQIFSNLLLLYNVLVPPPPPIFYTTDAYAGSTREFLIKSYVYTEYVTIRQSRCAQLLRKSRRCYLLTIRYYMLTWTIDEAGAVLRDIPVKVMLKARDSRTRDTRERRHETTF